MGLLDDFSGFVKTPEGQGLLAAVVGGLAGARRGTPLNNIGRAGVAGLTGYANANEQINQDALRKLQNEQLGLSVAEMKRKQEADAQAREVMKEYFGQGGLPNSSISPGLLAAQNAASPYQLAPPSIAQPPVTNQSPAIAQTPVTSQTQNTITPKTDLYLTYKNASDALARKGLIEQAKQYADMAEKNRPKFSTTPQKMVVGGKLTNVLVSEDGSVKTLDGYEVPPEMVSTELGGRVVWSDKNQIKPGQTMSKTATPGELMADARSREQFAFNKSQAGSKWQYDAGSDQWVKPPSAENPLGTVTPNAGKVAALRNIEYLSNQFTAKDGILDKSTQGGVMGLSGSIGRVVNSQSAREFDNAKEQMSTEMRKIFRIPGEGALSDKEQAQYGIQLPDVKNSPDLNRKIINDLITRSRGSAFPENSMGGAKQLPENPSAKNLVKGESYTLPNGQIGVWDGMGFKGK